MTKQSEPDPRGRSLVILVVALCLLVAFGKLLTQPAPPWSAHAGTTTNTAKELPKPMQLRSAAPAAAPIVIERSAAPLPAADSPEPLCANIAKTQQELEKSRFPPLNEQLVNRIWLSEHPSLPAEGVFTFCGIR